MKYLIVAVASFYVSVGAYAQTYPAAPLSPKGEQARSLSLRNMSGQVITSAQAHMTDGSNRVLTHETVQPNQAREIVVPRNACLEGVTVHLNNGSTLKADKLNDCRSSLIVVGGEGIDVRSANVRQTQTNSKP